MADGTYRRIENVKKHPRETTKIATQDKNQPLLLHTDAAKTGRIGYLLTHPNKDQEHIIYCCSTGLTEAKKWWCMTFFMLENVYNFTYGADTIKILTDHSPLIGLSKKCPDEIPNPRITALFNQISHYKSSASAGRTMS